MVQVDERKKAGHTIAREMPDTAKELRWHAEAILRLVAAVNGGELSSAAAMRQFAHHANEMRLLAGGDVEPQKAVE